MEDKDQCIMQSQYRGCWWTEEARSQVINSHGNYIVVAADGQRKQGAKLSTTMVIT